MRTWLGVLLAGILIVMMPPEGVAQERPERERSGVLVQIHGVVVERGTNARVQNVAVQIRSLEEGGEGRESVRMTDEEGRFAFPGSSPGWYLVEFHRLGYQTASDSVRLRAGSEVELVAEITPEAVELEPLVVQTTRRGRLISDGFYDRQRIGLGRFLTRSDIEERSPRYITDMLRTMPGVQVTPVSQGFGGHVRMRGGCRPELYVDGVRAVASRSMDEILQPQDVEAVEVYRGGETPARFAANNTCGVVAVWTRIPDAGDREGSFWKRLVVAGVFASLATLLTR